MNVIKNVLKTLSKFVNLKFLIFWNNRTKNKKINGKSSKLIPKRSIP